MYMEEASPEKAGVGGSIPSLATITTVYCRTFLPFLMFHSGIVDLVASITDAFYIFDNKRHVLW